MKNLTILFLDISLIIELKKIKNHIIFWAGYLLFLWLFAFIKSEGKTDFITFIFKNFLLVGVFYFNISIVFPYFFDRKRLLSIFYSLIGLVSFFLLKYGLIYIFLPYFGKPFFEPFSLNAFYPDNIFLYTTYAMYGLLYWYAQKFVLAERRLRIIVTQRLELQNTNLQLKNDNLNLQNEKIKIEYNFLKAQINPHFLYNTLNFFYSKVLMHSAQAAEGIVKLTDIMRYALRRGDEDGKVYLHEEIEHINNYIDLQQMRFNNTINIQFTITGHTEGFRILPHILVTLLENAFKHGDTINPDQPIVIHLQVNDQYLHYSIHNKIRIGPKDGPSTGVGLPNIADRLRMEYGNKQDLKYHSDGNFFDMHLFIQMNEINTPIINAEEKNDVSEN